MRRLALLLAALALPALAQTPALIEGDAVDRDRLAGEWVGGYDDAETGRHGAIYLWLAPGADSLWAVVTLLPAPTSAEPAPAAVPLAVHHVQVEGLAFRGSLVRFEDPAWGIELETTFGGALGPDGRLDGHFRSDGTAVDTIPRHGRWWAARAADRPTL